MTFYRKFFRAENILDRIKPSRLSNCCCFFHRFQFLRWRVGTGRGFLYAMTVQLFPRTSWTKQNSSLTRFMTSATRYRLKRPLLKNPYFGRFWSRRSGCKSRLVCCLKFKSKIEFWYTNNTAYDRAMPIVITVTVSSLVGGDK